MTYQQIKDKVVKENDIMTEKQFKVFIIRYTLGMLGLIIGICLLASTLVGFGMATLLGAICIFAYGTILDVLVEDLSKFKSMSKLVKFWWLSYIGFIAIVFILKYYRFI